MLNIFRIFISDFKRIKTNVVAVVIVIGLSILPCLYAWFNILSNWSPYGPDATSNIKVAVASDDKGITIDDTEFNMGETVIEGLEANTTILRSPIIQMKRKMRSLQRLQTKQKLQFSRRSIHSLSLR